MPALYPFAILHESCIKDASVEAPDANNGSMKTKAGEQGTKGAREEREEGKGKRNGE